MDKGKYHGHLAFLEKLFEGLQERVAASSKPGANAHAEAIEGCLAVIRRELRALETIPDADWQERYGRMEVRLADCFGQVAEGTGTVP